VQQEGQGYRAFKEPRALLGLQAQQEPLEVLVYKGLKVPLEQLELLVQLVTLVSRVFKALQVLTLRFLGLQG
jgi:hypothetical protein